VFELCLKKKLTFYKVYNCVCTVLKKRKSSHFYKVYNFRKHLNSLNIATMLEMV
jgi:hypothetical protein